LLFAALPSASAQSLVPFAPSTNHGGGFGTSSNSLTTGEFHGDAFADIVSATGNPEGLSIIKGAAGGTFLPEVGLLVGTGLYSSAPRGVDFEGDGDMDIVAGLFDVNTILGSATNGQIAVFLNDGTGNFTRQTLLSGLTSSQSNVFAVADLNRDGRADIVRSTAATNLIYMQALPGGGFAADVVVSSGFVAFNTISLANIDGDGDLDLVAVDGGAANTARIFANDGSGAFTLAHTAPFAAATTVVREVVDINGDGLPDLLCTDADATTKVSFYAGVSGGGFSATRTAITVPGSSVNSLRTADLDKDGVRDLLVSNTVSTPSFAWNIGWMRGTGGGSFGSFVLVNTYSGIANTFIAQDLNADTNPDLIVGGRGSSSAPPNVFVFINKTGQDPMVVTPPAARSYVLGDNIETSVYFGFPITVTGTPRISLQVGGSTVNANYVSGSGTSTLVFRYTVTLADLDLDGVQPASLNIDLNGGTMKDPINGDADLTLLATPFTNVIVNGAGPLVQNVTRLDPTPTNAPSVRFQVQFAEDVTGVDAADFELKQDAGDLDGGTVLSVTGSGSTYQVSATTGTGSGTLGLSVKSGATIADLAGDPLAKGFIGGQVYTLKRGTPITIDTIYTQNHADYRAVWNNGEITFVMDADPGTIEPSALVIPSNEVLTYAGPAAILARPAAATYDFIGVASGANMYLLPSSQKTGVPYLGMSGESVPTGTFARYQPADSRITSVNAYMKNQLVAMRSTSGGHMSVYTISSGNPRVWMATSNGIDSTDVFYQTPGSHSHRNIAFSQPGTYEVDLFISGFRDENANTTYEPNVDPYIESGIFTMVFGVDFPGGPANVALNTDMTGSAPVAVNDAFTAPSGTVITGNVLTNDTDPQSQPLTASLRTNAAQGTVSLAPNGSFNYTLSTPDYDGSDSFTYWANDGSGGWSFATVNLTLTPANAMPSFVKGTNKAHAPGTTGTQSFTGWATSIADGDAGVEQALTFNVNVTSGAAIFSTTPAISSGGTLSYTLSGAPGTAQVSVTLTDDATAGTAALTTAAQTFTVSVASSAVVPFTTPNFQDPNVTTSGSAQLADLNGDGKLDMVTSGGGYLLGVGDGTFQPRQDLPDSEGLRNDIVAVDYDGDGDLDLLVSKPHATDTTADTLMLFRNNGSATFTAVPLLALPRLSTQLEAGDFNGDGRVDVVYGKATTAIAYALQQPDGSLGTEVVLPVNTTTSTVKVADIDADGDVDIVVGNRTGSNAGAITVFKNSGSGTFSLAQTVATGNFPTVLKLTDMNGDGLMDIVSTQLIANTRVGWYPQAADGTFGVRVNVMTAISQLNSMDVGDVNGDGIPDIVAAANTLVGSTLTFTSVWSPGLGGGAYGNPILLDPNQGNSTAIFVANLDGDAHPDIIATGNSDSTKPSAVRVLINKTGENPMVLTPPAARTRVGGDPIELSVYFGFPITVTGTPRIALNLSGNTVYAIYVSGSGTGTLTFRYTVAATDTDFDGVQLASNVIELNGGTLTNPLGGAAVLEFPNLPFTGVVVNAAGPLVQSITRVDSQATTAGTVRFSVQFAEAVTGADAADFTVRMIEGDLAGAVITGLSGSGSLYEVTVSTGTGSGTLGLSVNVGASINDLNGDLLALGYAGGQVYTVRKQPVAPSNYYYTDGHADYRPVHDNGEFSYVWHGDPGVLQQVEYASDEVITYLDNTSIVTRPAGANYDFIGVGANQPFYLSNSSGNIASVPFLGWSGESLVANDFAEYRPAEDPRITSATLREYVKVQMVAFRSDSGGEFSLFSGTTPTVWFATSDGIGATDNIWLYRTHFHRETAFSKPGRYEIDVVISGYLDGNGNNALDATDVYVESGIKTMVFGVDFPAQWRQENFGSTAAAGNAASGADPELDGISNRLEYAFGLNPSASSTTPLSLTPGGAVLERGLPIVSGNYAMFLRRRDYQAAGLTYTPQVSTDLTTWQPVTATPEVIGSDAEMDLVRVPLPVAAGDRQFFNVSVTMP
jgi:hypothetical protein